MILTRRLLAVLNFYSFFALVYSDRDKQPMIFNPYTLDIYNPQVPQAASNADDYAFVCPAEEPEEHELVDKFEFRDESLFVRNYCSLQEQNENPIKCEKIFELSVVYNYSHKRIEFGFEVYYRRTENFKNFAKSDIRKFGWVTESGRLFQRAERWMINHPMDPRDPRQAVLKKWNFVWVPKIMLLFNKPSWSLTSVKYFIYPVAIDQLLAKCHHYNLARNVYDSPEKLDDFYNPSNQRKIFSQLDLNSISDPSCALEYNCVKKYNLVMPYHFQASISQPILCSDLTSVPIWHKISEELLNRMEIFFTAIAQVTGYKLEILTGILDVLTLPSSDKRKSQAIYLRKKKIPVPRIIYKIVRYKLPKCDDEKQLCWFDVVIVIHNQTITEIADENRLCPKDKCREWGWESIQYLNEDDSKAGEKVKHEYIYCCRLSEKIEKTFNYKKGTAESEDFNLKDFPQYNEDKRKVEYFENKRKDIIAKMDEIMNTIQKSKIQNLETSSG